LPAQALAASACCPHSSAPCRQSPHHHLPARKRCERLQIASFGATSSLRLLPQLLAAFRQAHPLVEVHIEEAVNSVVLQWLLERRVELGFVVLPDERFDSVPLIEGELVAVLPATHPLAQKTSISALDFHNQPFIRTSAGSGPRVDAFLADKGAVPNTLYRFEQLSSMMGFVAQGDALTIAARLALPAPPGRRHLPPAHAAQPPAHRAGGAAL